MSKLNEINPDEYLLTLFSKHNRIYLGDELKEKLVANLGKTPAAARKIVERFAAKGLIKTSSPVSFGRKTFAYYAIDKTVTFDDLLGLTRERRPPLFRLLSAIKTCGGILSYYEALKISAAPLVQSKTKTIGLEQLLKELEFFEVISRSADQNEVKYLVANYIEPAKLTALKARHFSLMLVDTCLLYDVLISLSKLNLIDNKYIRYRHRKTPSLGQTHNNFVWDAFSYTRTTGINTRYGKSKESSVKQALVVVDMVVSRRYEQFDYNGFLDRIRVLQNNTKIERKVVPVLVYREISTHALNEARAYGMLTYSIASFFGERIYDILNNITQVKLSENSALTETADPVTLMAEALDAIEDSGNMVNLQNVTGDFFQSLMYQLFHHLYPSSTIEQGKTLPAMDDTEGRKKRYEYDFLIHAMRTNEVIAVELKGTMTNTTITLGNFDKKNTLKWFFERTFPSFTKHFQTPAYQNTKIRAVFVTSGKYDPDGKAYLTSLDNGKTKPKELNVGYDGKQLLALVRHESLGLLAETLTKYFIKLT